MNKTFKYVLIIVGIIILFAIFGFFYKDSKSNSLKEKKKTDKDVINEYYNENQDKFNLEMMKYVSSKGYILADGNLLVEVTNLNECGASIKTYIEFLDENNETITMEDQYIGYVEAGKKSYGIVYLNDELRKIYETYRIVAVPSYTSSIVSYYDNVELISFNEKKGTIQYKVNADTKDRLEIEWGLLYYDENDNIVDYSRAFDYDVKANKIIKNNAYLSYGSYSRIEIVLLEAHT